MSSALGARLLAVLKISKPTFWLIWATPFIYAYLASAKSYDWFVFLANVGAICILEASVCLHNEYVDRDEDIINQPNRVKLADIVGYRTIRFLFLAGYAIGLVYLVLNTLFVNPLLGPIALVAGFLMLFYNFWVRFKRMPYVAEVAIGAVVFLDFLAGWVMGGGTLLTLPPVAYLLTYYFFAIAVIKDLPDAAGDAAVGSKTLYSISSKLKRQLLSGVIYLSPFLLIGSSVAAGVVPVTYLLTLLLLPFAVYLIFLAGRAHSLYEFISVYHLGFFYCQTFFVVLFSIFFPSTLSYVVAVALVALRTALVAFRLDPRLNEPGLSIPHEISSLTRSKT
jgi:4-hydroxybenzoate polyprenyltransferase